MIMFSTAAFNCPSLSSVCNNDEFQQFWVGKLSRLRYFFFHSEPRKNFELNLIVLIKRGRKLLFTVPRSKTKR